MWRLNVVICMVFVGCNDGSHNTAIPPTAPPAVTYASSLRLTGSAALSAIGQTQQLTVTAALSNGTSKDVTIAADWRSSDPSVVTVSAGLLTVVGFGVAVVTCEYQTPEALAARYLPVRSTLTVRPSAPGTFVIAGRVNEPGRGGLPDVTVTDTATRATTQSNGEGLFTLASMPRAEAHLTFTKDGYEPTEIDASQDRASAPLQRIIRVRPGDTIQPPNLAPNDMSYAVGNERCVPCRLIRLVADTTGTVHVRITWTDARVPLTLWANGSATDGSAGEVARDVVVSTGESVVYLGVRAVGGYVFVNHMPFWIEVSQP